VQPGLELEEVQVPPRALQSVMNPLPSSATTRARQRSRLALNIEIDAVLGSIQLYITHRPPSL
jgi:hypothetical protein